MRWGTDVLGISYPVRVVREATAETGFYSPESEARLQRKADVVFMASRLI